MLKQYKEKKNCFTGLTTKDNTSQLTHIVGGVCGGVMGAMVSKVNNYTS